MQHQNIKDLADIYANTFRFIVNDKSWYESHVADFTEGYMAAMKFYASKICGEHCNKLNSACDICKSEYEQWKANKNDFRIIPSVKSEDRFKSI